MLRYLTMYWLQKASFRESELSLPTKIPILAHLVHALLAHRLQLCALHDQRADYPVSHHLPLIYMKPTRTSHHVATNEMFTFFTYHPVTAAAAAA